MRLAPKSLLRVGLQVPTASLIYRFLGCSEERRFPGKKKRVVPQMAKTESVRLVGTLRRGPGETGQNKVAGLREGNGRHLDVITSVGKSERVRQTCRF